MAIVARFRAPAEGQDRNREMGERCRRGFRSQLAQDHYWRKR